MNLDRSPIIVILSGAKNPSLTHHCFTSVVTTSITTSRVE